MKTYKLGIVQLRVKFYGNAFLRDLTNDHFKKGEDYNICKSF